MFHYLSCSEVLTSPFSEGSAKGLKNGSLEGSLSADLGQLVEQKAVPVMVKDFDLAVGGSRTQHFVDVLEVGVANMEVVKMVCRVLESN